MYSTPQNRSFRMTRLTLISAVCIFLLAACGDAPATDAPGTALIVENPFHGPHQNDNAYRLDMEEIIRFGAEEEPEREMLSQVRGVEVDGAGNVYILDGNRLISFTAEGDFRWESGREGEGPGEFNRAWSMFMTPDGHLLVRNQGGQRFDYFTLSGAYVRSLSRDLDVFDGFANPIGFLDDTTAVVTGAVRDGQGVIIRMAQTSADWQVADTFRVEPEMELDLPTGFSIGAGGAILDGNIVLARPDVYELGIFSPTGDSVRIVRRDVRDFTRPGYATFDGGAGIRSYSRTSMPVVLPGGYRIIAAGWPTNIPDPDAHAKASFAQEDPPDPINHSTLDVYDDDWRLLFSIENDDLDALEFGTVMAQPAPGDLYIVRASPYPHVARVRVAVEGTGSTPPARP